MYYTLPTGRKINIPDLDLDRIQKGLKVDREEALTIWLEDEGYLTNEEQIELDKKAKASKITQTIHQARKEPSPNKPKRTVERKADKTKEELVNGLADYLKGEEQITNVTIANKGKLITFTFNGENFKLDLIRTRQPKDKK